MSDRTVAVHLASTLAVLAVGVALDRWRPAFAVPAGAEGRARTARNGVLAGLVLAVVFVVLVPIKHLAVDHQLWRWSDLPVIVAAAAAVVLLDLVDYAYHRLAHVTALWRFHQVHHLDEGFDTTTTLRIHPGDMLLGGLAHVPAILLLGIPVEGIVVYNLLFVPLAVLHHSNARLPDRLWRAAGRLVVTPPYHMTHHQADLPNTNSSYASILVVWDHLFGTANPRRRTSSWSMGVDYSADQPLRRLLVLPFRRRQRYART